MRVIRFLLLVCAVLIWGIWWSDHAASFASRRAGADVEQEIGVKVERVVDGDTIELFGGEKVRYIGVNTPESVDPRRPVQCFGKEASEYNKQLVEGKRIYLEKDISDKDKYDRLLRYVYLDDPEATTGARMVNEILVREGYAQVSSFPPDVKYAERFLAVQAEAKANKRGLWGKCPVK